MKILASILLVGLSALTPGFVAPLGAAEPSEQPVAARSVSAALRPFLDNQIIAGAVTLVASKDKVLSVESIGYADLAQKKPMKADDLFWIASMTKPITATALMMLVDEGKLTIDDPVEKYLPEFKERWVSVEKDKEHMLLKKARRPITIRDLLTHTSGMANAAPAEAKVLDTLPLRTAVLSYAIMPLESQPGAKFSYSSAGLNTAGRIVEVVSGMPYEEFLSKRIFEPLGMKDTTFWPNDEQLRRLAKSYKPNADKTGLEETPIAPLTYPLSSRTRYAYPAGGLFSTAADLSNFCRMILARGMFNGKRYLSEAAVEQTATIQTGEGVKSYGLGWDGDPAPANRLGALIHAGAYKTLMCVDFQRQIAMVMLVQAAGGFRDPVFGKTLNSTFLKAARNSVK